jgi:hypothetical protein
VFLSGYLAAGTRARGELELALGVRLRPAQALHGIVEF